LRRLVGKNLPRSTGPPDAVEAPFTPFDPHGRPEHARRFGKVELRYVIPNLITVLAICAGLSGIRLAFEGRFEQAVLMVLAAAFLDGIDGRIARMMKGQSKFGAQMDSIADAVNFGAAPALVLYAAVLDQVRSIGWIAALVYAIACCLRLARFNVMNDNPDQAANSGDFFVGVPAPAGACLVMLPVYVWFLGVQTTAPVALLSSLYTILIAFLMISQLPVFSGKKATTRIPREIVLPLILGLTIYVALFVTFTWETLTLSALAYIASLPFGVRSARRQAAASAGKIIPGESAGPDLE
jgi:CDP-diacylglycerol---serine O-phosphatidyltransferase